MSSNNTTLLRSDPSSLVINETDAELEYRAAADLTDKKILKEKLRCTACDKILRNVFTKFDLWIHPTLKVLICEDCEEFYGVGEFSVDEDGSDKYCRWCGQGGSLYCCSKCSVAICQKCIKRNFSRSYRSEVEEDDWQCFVCDSKPVWPHRALAAAVQKYVQENQHIRKTKRAQSDEENSSPGRKSKRTKHNNSDDEFNVNNSFSSKKSQRKKSSIATRDENSDDDMYSRSKAKKSKTYVDDDDETGDNSKKEKQKYDQRKSLREKSKSKGMISSDEDGTSYDIKKFEDEKTHSPRKEKEKRRSRRSSSPEKSDNDGGKSKSRRTSRKLNIDYRETDEGGEVSSRSKRKQSNLSDQENDSDYVASSRRRSRKIVSGKSVDTESDRSVFRDKNNSRRRVRKLPFNYRSASRKTDTSIPNDEDVPLDNDTIKRFKHMLKDTLRDFDKLLRIISDRKETFYEKYVCEDKHLRSASDAASIKTKYVAFIANLTNSAKQIESIFLSNVEPLLSTVCKYTIKDDKSEDVDDENKKHSDEIKNTTQVAEEKNPSEVSTESTLDSETEKKTEKDDIDQISSQDTSVKLNDPIETSTPAPITSEKQDDAETVEKDIASHSVDDSVNASAMTNGVDSPSEYSAEEKCDQNSEVRDSLADPVVSDSLIVNLGTDEESVMSTKNFDSHPSKKESSIDDKSPASVENDQSSDREDEEKRVKNSEHDDANSDVMFHEEDNEGDSSIREKEARNDPLQLSDGISSSENEGKSKTDDELVENGGASPRSTDSKSEEKRAEHEVKPSDTEDEDGANRIDVNGSDISSTDNDPSSKCKEKQAKNDLLQSSDMSANEHSSKLSDSDMSGIDVLAKNNDVESRPKRLTKRSSNKHKTCTDEETDDEDKEINRLTNLQSLKRKKRRSAVDESESDEAHAEEETHEKKNNVHKNVKKPIPKKSLEDYISNGSDTSGIDKNDEDDPFSQFNSFLEEKKSKLFTQDDLCKKQLLDSSDSNGNESDDEDDLLPPSKSEKLKKNFENKKVKNKLSNSDDGSSTDSNREMKRKKRSSWRNDNLLKTKISESDTSDDEKMMFRVRRREARQAKNDRKKDDNQSSDSEDLFRTSRPQLSVKKWKNLKSSSRSSSSSSVEVFEETPPKNRKSRKRIKKLWSDSDNSNEEDADKSQSTQNSASKGRKNIRKVMKDEELAEETKITAKDEEQRKKRIAERQALFNEVFQVLNVETQAPSKLVLDFDPENKTELVTVHPDLVKKLKPHQVKGIKFMWDSCFESIKQVESSQGGGCIIAHCMGLGKTLQVIVLVHTLLNHQATKVKNVLIICPVSTISNWVKEFKTWLENIDDSTDIDVWSFNKNQRNAKERAYLLKRWMSDGGVLIIGYDKFRTLVNCNNISKKWRETIHEALLNPGPDLVICDEGHMLKNEKSAISIATMKIRTRRRVVLTGTPLQNNLIEYHCMVQFVKPKLLGDKKEFQNRFANPITNGQFTNSTAHDVRVMKRRSHVLHKMLDGIIQRFDYNVLTPFLPPKHEFVISVALSDLQAKLYDHYIKTYSRVSNNGENRTLFKDYQIMRLIWTHPFAMNVSFEKAQKTEPEEDDSMDEFIVSSSSESSKSEEENSDASVIAIEDDDKKKEKSKYRTRGNEDADASNKTIETAEVDTKADAWWRPFITDEDIDNYKQGPKLVLLFAILRECESIGDKILIFSQSIPSLDMIEYFLQKTNEFSHYGSLLDAETDSDYLGTWKKNVDYFRLDGSTPSDLRTQYTNRFNHPLNTRARLFLISTKAGGLGINLTAANRVIIFDASWNPSHDVQSIFRVYRFGQKKPCYIYRFLSQGTMEEKIYERQVTKLSISCRVVDEQQIDRHFSRNEVEELYTFNRKTPSEDEIPKLPKDRLMAEILKEYRHVIISYHEHDSLLENIVNEELTEEERKQAWEEYENDKQPKAPMYQQLRNSDFNSVTDEAIMNSIRLQNPNATPEQLEEMKNKVRYKIMQYYAEQQRMLHLASNQAKSLLVPIANRKELEEQAEIKRRTLAHQLQMNQRFNTMPNKNPGRKTVVGLPMVRMSNPVTPSKIANSPSKLVSPSASPVKGVPFKWPDRTPLKHINSSVRPFDGDISPLKRDEGAAAAFDEPTSFNPLETPSSWAFKWNMAMDLGLLERILKANCRFSARYERVGENILMHLPYCVRTDTLKQKLVDHLANISFKRILPNDMDERDVLDLIVSNVRLEH